MIGNRVLELQLDDLNQQEMSFNLEDMDLKPEEPEQEKKFTETVLSKIMSEEKPIITTQKISNEKFKESRIERKKRIDRERIKLRQSGENARRKMYQVFAKVQKAYFYRVLDDGDVLDAAQLISEWYSGNLYDQLSQQDIVDKFATQLFLPDKKILDLVDQRDKAKFEKESAQTEE